jgi:hypothetical protein
MSLPKTSGQFHQHFMNTFAPVFLRQKISNLKFKYKKALRKTFVQKKPRLKCWWNWHKELERPNRKSNVRKSVFGAVVLLLLLLYFSVFPNPVFLKFHVRWGLILIRKKTSQNESFLCFVSDFYCLSICQASLRIWKTTQRKNWQVYSFGKLVKKVRSFLYESAPSSSWLLSFVSNTIKFQLSQ